MVTCTRVKKRKDIRFIIGVMLDSYLGNKSDIFHHNYENNQLKR